MQLSSLGLGSCELLCVVLPQPSLLMAAMTAPAAGEVFDMEGLEYLGDVVLKFLTTNYLLQVRVHVCVGEIFRGQGCEFQVSLSAVPERA